MIFTKFLPLSTIEKGYRLPTIAIMQPYLFPYIGYYQLVNAVDVFYFYNDVNYIKRGWINRNLIRINGKPTYFTVPLNGASQNKLIHDVPIVVAGHWQRKLLRSVQQNYGKAPYFKEVYPMIDKVIERYHADISSLAMDSIEEVSKYLQINTDFRSSTGICAEKKGQDRIIAICNKKGQKPLQYINPYGGVDLYDRDKFEKENIQLSFLQTNPELPDLSIIDVLMHHSKDTIKEWLGMWSDPTAK